MVDLQRLVSDLTAERGCLEAILGPLGDREWELATPAVGWTVRDQVSHLAFEDEVAVLAVRSAAEFAALRREEEADPVGFTRRGPVRGRAMTPAGVLAWWRAAGARLEPVLRGLSPTDRVSWFAGDMGAASFVTARLMETWAHGQDVADALGVERAPTGRLRSIAHLGVAAHAYSYRNHGRTPPERAPYVALEGPDGAVWTWGEPGPDRVTGPALDFCRVVTRRRHVADTGLVVEGDRAREWMAIAQAYAGPPGPGRRPGQFRRQ